MQARGAGDRSLDPTGCGGRWDDEARREAEFDYRLAGPAVGWYGPMVFDGNERRWRAPADDDGGLRARPLVERWRRAMRRITSWRPAVPRPLDRPGAVDGRVVTLDAVP